MIKTEMMKKYEAETGDNSQLVWHGGSFASDDYIAWLEAQLTWQPVSEELENMSYALGVRYGHNTAIRRAHMQHMCDMLTKLEEITND